MLTAHALSTDIECMVSMSGIIEEEEEGAWDEMNQWIIDQSVKQWCTQLCAYLGAEENQFQHKLKVL